MRRAFEVYIYDNGKLKQFTSHLFYVHEKIFLYSGEQERELRPSLPVLEISMKDELVLGLGAAGGCNDLEVVVQQVGRPAVHSAAGTDDRALEEYEVEEILAKTTKKGIVEYLIRWSGYGSENDSWGPITHLSCPEKDTDGGGTKGQRLV